MTSKNYWTELKESISIENRALINGCLRMSSDGSVLPSYSPIDGALITSVASCSDADVDDAVRSARGAFEHGSWSQLSHKERKCILKRIAALIRVHSEELALLDTMDMGKPISDSLFDAHDSADCFDWYAEALDKVYGEVLPVDPDLFAFSNREPIGVVAAIVPWNYPLQMAAWKVAPALAAGNSVLLKPSNRTPLSAIKLGMLAKEAGLPDGVLQILPGGSSVGERLSRHMDVDCVTFTGSTNVGKAITRYSADSNLKKVWLELGGKSPLIIFPDCPDLSAAAENAAAAIFSNQGAVCSAASRLFLHDHIYDQFLPLLLEAARNYCPGDPLDPDTTMGALVDGAHLAMVDRYVQNAQEEGARILTGGSQFAQQSGGFYYLPTILECANANAAVVKEEVFGPVLTVQRFSDTDDVVTRANDSPYGLVAGLWTSNMKLAHSVSRRLRVGVVFVNGWDEGGDDYSVPFGGYKQSGNGRDKSLHALEKYSEIKATILSLY